MPKIIKELPDLTTEEVQEFKKLALEVYGLNLTDDEAKDQGSRLIMLFEMMLKAKRKDPFEARNYQPKVVQNNERR